jgi:hypothetical protein
MLKRATLNDAIKPPGHKVMRADSETKDELALRYLKLYMYILTSELEQPIRVNYQGITPIGIERLVDTVKVVAISSMLLPSSIATIASAISRLGLHRYSLATNPEAIDFYYNLVKSLFQIEPGLEDTMHFYSIRRKSFSMEGLHVAKKRSDHPRPIADT